ncbi:MAG TPA: calcium-binding protein [Solirubrobacteraceae bacterium]|jgi:Ca2+-binding RTX toxin-like protein
MRRSLPFLIVLLTLLVPSVAAGQEPATNPGTVTVTSLGALEYVARDGQANQVTVDFGRDAITVTDTAAALTAGSGCQPGASIHEVTCSRVDSGPFSFGTARYQLDLGDLADVLQVTDDGSGSAGTIGFGFSPGGGVDGGTGDDHLVGGNGGDTLRGGPGSDVLEGGDGGDTVDYSDHTEAVAVTIGGTGGNQAQDGTARDTVDATVENILGGDGADTLTGSDDANLIGGAGGGDTIAGNGGDDFVAGNSLVGAFGFQPGAADGDDTIDAGEGDDTLAGGDGADDLAGGPGSDGALYSDHGVPDFGGTGTGHPVVVTIGGADDDGNAEDGPAGARDNVHADVENLSGTVLGDTLVGDDDANRLDGAAGADTISGHGGADTLNGGSDTVADTLNGDAGNDVAVAATSTGSQGEQIADGGDTFDGGDGVDRIDYTARSAAVTVTLAGTASDDGAQGEGDRLLNVESATGGSAGDTLTGTDGANRLHGGPGGDDTLHGAGGADRLFGGYGFSTSGSIQFGDGADTFDAGAGDDEIFSRDTLVDTAIDCGPDTDRVRPDTGEGTVNNQPAPSDASVIDADCEDKGLPETASGTGTATTEDGADGVTPADPIDTTVTHPSSAANVALTESENASANVPSGFTAEGPQVRVTVDPISPSDDTGILHVTLTIDSSIAPDGAGGRLAVNGSPIPACTTPGELGPDPCISGSSTVGGDLQLDVIGRSAVVGQAAPVQLQFDWQLPTPGRVFVDRSTRALIYTARDGQANDVHISYDADSVSLTDTAGATTPLTPGRGCSSVSEQEVRCTRDESGFSFNRYGVNLGDGADSVDVDGTAVAAAGLGLGGPQTLSGQLNGGTGDDELHGGPGSDLLIGGDDADVLDGAAGTDTAWYGDHTEAVTLTLAPTASNDGSAVDGPAGLRDQIDASVENATGGAGDDSITGDTGANVLAGGGGGDELRGGDGGDQLYGAFGGFSAFFVAVVSTPDSGDSLQGERGNDRLAGAGGGDTFTGGAGIDTADYSDHGQPGFDPDTGVTPARGVTVTIGGPAGDDGSDDDGPEGARDTVQTDVEAIDGGQAGDVLTGDGDANRLNGGAGEDTLNGGGGSDVLLGGVETFGPPQTDTLNGDEGADTYVAGNGMGTHDGADVFSGGPGTDLADYTQRQSAITVTLADDSANDGQSGENDNIKSDVEDVTGGQGADTLTGDDDPNRLSGGPLSGADTIDGAGGDDVLSGGIGFGFGDGADTINGGAGQDTVRARDGVVDAVDCGSEIDVAYTDVAQQGGSPIDDSDTACENVNPEVVQQSVEEGGTAGSASEASPADPVDVAITSPNEGAVVIQESVVTQSQAPAGSDFLALQMNITAPDASEDVPLVLKFVIDSTLVPAAGADAIKVYRNGSALDEGCPALVAPDTTPNATANGCIAGREVLSGGAAEGDVRITVLTAHASEWNFAVPEPTDDGNGGGNTGGGGENTGGGGENTGGGGGVDTTTPPTVTPPNVPVTPPNVPVTPPADRTAPAITLTPKGGRLKKVLKAGLSLPVACDEACRVVVTATLDKALAKKLKLKGAVAKGSGAGGTKIAVRFTSAAKRKLARQRKVVLTLKVVATDAAGNAATATKKLTLKR